ncbi:sulfate adenylyltransferase subunit CysN [Limibacillus halophilus]|uniref:Multifunctional fusion protein n=1 Tax=Limibacillus halophilus TaxID=1579333 RepID=A0A839SY95_9PROT|nr:sulfate adenylyltransferase subunit CysN [Limibacillus halophilus]MBB3066594.1 bifunctional enzyme CysN/CysC [Limibacillus halophilus]
MTAPDSPSPEVLTAETVEEYLKAQDDKDLLRFITCGSVDDGKSTLIGRLLYESKLIFEDQLATLEADSKKVGTQGEKLDLALLVDGLQAEREQGITIDVAYRFFSTDARKFIVADTPGHEQYTRNMATGASTASVAVILIDARKGVLTQTRRHSRIVSLVGIRHVVVAINKMDLVGYDVSVFEKIEQEYRTAVADLGFADIHCVPVSALDGENVVQPSQKMPWYNGPTLLSYLETVPVADAALAQKFCMPVQWVNRPNLDFRGFSGRIAGGTVRCGDSIRVLPSGVESRVRSIVTFDGELDEAGADQSVTLTLTDEVDVSRGDVIAAAAQPPQAADQFEVKLLWMAEHHLMPGRAYTVKIGTKQVTGTVTDIKHLIDVNSGAHLAGKAVELNEIAVVNISFDRPVVFEPYQQNRTLGAFIMIDRMTNDTVGAGMIDFALRRASNIHWQALDVSKESRATLKNQTARCLWFTGLSGSGKSTIANLLEKRLHSLGKHTYLLDGDNVRHGLNRDLGFTETDRVENIRRVAEVSRLMVDAGLIVLVSFISPYRSERDLARSLFDEGEFLEVFVDTPLALCEARDPKGLYAKARRGEIKNFTGIDSGYEPPEKPEMRLETADLSPEQAVTLLLDYLKEH